jgi:hypothetical protein
MRDADAFESTVFLGLARAAKKDPYRLSLFGQHLESDERPVIVLPMQGGTLLVTDRRLLELRAHLEVHGAWNVKEFQGYTVHRAFAHAALRTVDHVVRAAAELVGSRRVEDVLVLGTANGTEELIVSRGPEPTLLESEFTVLREAVLGRHP